MTVGRPSINFRTKQVVYFRESAQPYVGFENPDGPIGWKFDIKRWCSLFDLRVPSMPQLTDASSQGVSESVYFKSGVGSVDAHDLRIDSIDEMFMDHERHWVPIVRDGFYYRYKTPFFLYGDNSRVQYVDPADNKSGRNYVVLDVEPEMGTPIMAASFKRHPVSRLPMYETRVEMRGAFSGIYVDGEEQETVSLLGKINWSNVDFNKREFIVDDTVEGVTSLRFNKDYVKTHGVIPQAFQDLAACELLGQSNGTAWQVYYLSRFPVLADSSFHLYIVADSTWEEWTRVDTWFELVNSTAKKRYFVDKDLGIIYLGSGTTGGVPQLGRFIVATYRSTLRIQYEEYQRPTEIAAWTADVSPVAQHVNQGFVCITHDRMEAANIVLDINKSAIPFSNPREYGPVYVGTDYAVLRATVTDLNGLPLPNVEVGFTMSPANLGYLSGGISATSATNGRGEAYTAYQPPVSGDDLGFYTTTVRASTNPSYTSHKDVIVHMSETGLDGKEDEVYLFQVLKDDLLLGYDSVDEWIYYNLTAPAWVVDAETYATWKDEIIIEHDLKDWAGVQADGSLVGRKVVVYKINPTTDNLDSTAIHPITGELGAVVPVRPELIEKITDDADEYYGLYRLIYPEDAVPDCDPDDSDNNVGGYWVASSRVLTFQAHCWSPHYNRIIYSNKLLTRVALPNYLLGVYVNSLMQEIPFGWKLPSDTDNVAAGLNGATFITINPHSGPYQIIDIIGGQTGDEWASAPFKSIGFQFEIVGL